jgi:hypothetical protein
MSKPETLKDIIEETMRVSGVSYPVPVREKQFGGDHYKRMGIEPWDVVDTWPLEQRIGYYRGGALKYTMRMGNKDERLTRSAEGFALPRKIS